MKNVGPFEQHRNGYLQTVSILTRLQFCHLIKSWENMVKIVLTLKAPIMTIVAFAVKVDQDQAAQNMHPDI